MKYILSLLLLFTTLHAQDLHNTSKLGQAGRNQLFQKGIQVQDTSLLNGLVYLTGKIGGQTQGKFLTTSDSGKIVLSSVISLNDTTYIKGDSICGRNQCVYVEPSKWNTTGGLLTPKDTLTNAAIVADNVVAFQYDNGNGVFTLSNSANQWVTTRTISVQSSQSISVQSTGNSSSIIGVEAGITGTNDAGVLSDSLVYFNSTQDRYQFQTLPDISNATANMNLVIDSSGFLGTKEIDVLGWGLYRDTVYTQASPYTLTAGQIKTLPISGGDDITAYEPNGVALYNSTDSTITPINIGDGYDVRIDFKARSSSLSDYAVIKIDIGSGTPILIVQRTFTFPKGQNTWHTLSVGFPIYALGTFKNNGGKIKFEAGNGTLDIADQVLFIKKDFNQN